MTGGSGANRSGALFALASAALFGVSTPLAKLLLGDGLDPWLLAGLLYLGSGAGLLLLRLGGRALGRTRGEAPLQRRDLPWMAAAIACGGVVAPVLLMVGLSLTEASSAALLLNVEGLATMALAWLVFREHAGRMVVLGAAAILAGAALLSWQPGTGGFGWGTLAIAGACVAWGLDNNLTRKISGADPVGIAAAKGLIAGAVNFCLALAAGATPPAPFVLANAAVLGFFGYGVSLVLFILALRHLGTARTGAYFSTAPFIGALLAIWLFGDAVTAQLVGAALLMGFGVVLHLFEAHQHEHAHVALEHEHRHAHDTHHDHPHGEEPMTEPHSHAHRHRPVAHKHPHYPDLHHRHGH